MRNIASVFPNVPPVAMSTKTWPQLAHTHAIGTRGRAYPRAYKGMGLTRRKYLTPNERPPANVLLLALPPPPCPDILRCAHASQLHTQRAFVYGDASASEPRLHIHILI